MKLYKFLDGCLNIKKLNKLLAILIKNYKIFDHIKRMSNSFDLQLYNLGTYNNNNNDENIILMFRLLEKHFYNLIYKNANRNLKYKDENNKNKSQFEYLVFLTNTDLNFDIFRVYLLFYYTNIRLYDNKFYLGLDFEFNTKVVAMMQINFEQPLLNLYNYSLIFLFDPNQLNIKWKKMLTTRILCNKKVVKILHGSDSLDIPFVYNELLDNNIDMIKNFNLSFIDTKFLCEYSYYSKNQQLGKCKINYLLLKEEIISQDKFDQLQKEEENMGPIYDIIIDINNISELLINYTLYDVLYLYHLTNFYKINFKDFDLINEITQLTFMHKRDIISVIPVLEINKINNYYIFIKNKPARLNDIFNNFLRYLKRDKLIDNLLKINYFKGTLIFIFKYELYYYLVKKNITYEKYSDKIKYNKRILNLNYDYNNKKLFLKKLINPVKEKISKLY